MIKKMGLFLLGQSVPSHALELSAAVEPFLSYLVAKPGAAARACQCMSIHRLPPVHLDSCHVTVTISGKPPAMVQTHASSMRSVTIEGKGKMESSEL